MVELYDVDHIHLLGGEPLLYNNLFNIFKYFKNEADFSINTNEILLDRKFIRGLSKYENIKEIVVSLDGFTPSTNNKIRGMGVFHEVSKNYLELLKYKRKENLTLICSISIVITPDNIKELLDINTSVLREADNVLFNMMYEEGNSVKYYSLTKNFYNEYILFLDELTSNNVEFNYKVDSTPLILNILGLEIDRCACNSQDNIRYADNKGELYICGPKLYHNPNVDKERDAICKKYRDSIYFLNIENKVKVNFDCDDFYDNIDINNDRLLIKSNENLVFLTDYFRNMKKMIK